MQFADYDCKKDTNPIFHTKLELNRSDMEQEMLLTSKIKWFPDLDSLIFRSRKSELEVKM